MDSFSKDIAFSEYAPTYYVTATLSPYLFLLPHCFLNATVLQVYKGHPLGGGKKKHMTLNVKKMFESNLGSYHQTVDKIGFI